jgi:hypothetical protein
VVRDVEGGGARPTGLASTVVGAALAPVALVALTKLLAAGAGTTYGALFQRSYGEAATVGHFATMAVLTLLVVVPMLLLVCQVIVQGGLQRVVGGDAAVALTTLLAGFLLVDATGGLAMFPERGRVGGAVRFVVGVAVAAYGWERYDRRWLRYLSLVPVALLGGATVVSAVAAVETVPPVLFVGLKLGVLGVAAYAYERTESLLSPALTYAAFLAASEAVVFSLEAGVQHW